MRVRVYVEGGGEGGVTIARCREGFREFFTKLGIQNRRLIVNACGDRASTFREFRLALKSRHEDFLILLVDSEEPVAAGDGCWTHLKRHDRWTKPKGTTNESAHLMVQCMEAWFLADQDAVARYFEHGFRPKVLPNRADIEQVLKQQVLDRLDRAAKNTTKKGYHKTRDGFALLKLIDPAKVRAASPHADRLCEIVSRESA